MVVIALVLGGVGVAGVVVVGWFCLRMVGKYEELLERLGYKRKAWVRRFKTIKDKFARRVGHG